MTSSWSLFKALSWPRFKQMSLLLGIEALAVIVTSLWTAIKGNFTAATLFYNLCAWMALPLIVGFILLAVSNEKFFRAGTFWLLPISDWRRYTINLVVSLVNIVYVWLVQVILFCLTLWIGWNELMGGLTSASLFFSQFDAGSAVQFALGTLLVLVLVTILIWSTITLCHFVTNATKGFLPRFRQRFVNVIITVVVIYVAFRLANLLISMVSFLSSQLVNQGQIDSLWVGSLVMLAVILVEGVLNTLMLQKWVEPTLN
ncbi:ABC transporter permease [Lactiplantibacillus plantarum]|uniref:ABC transporter permease n=1 Tax=Lactiplantibacillus plantarum TaxID=1590 RepID=UPI00203BD324|nr:ABC transporter permease [Lactiplantibacillus plantarum]MCM2587238.1 ABC transporter permease [Lactiplantibacillus plantarum]MCM2598296.1 ABC transporter permease [Lactiplantibacillus plantarum]MCM2600250.1 ABC transporter permease [Lactiplantibacillus plantarum]MCM2608810.1 ABC transporter permease [Lactiplantibacillus plantarum]MCM2610607.1 ABC transporter permease [Lactiplantibacillus plantarum]